MEGSQRKLQIAIKRSDLDSFGPKLLKLLRDNGENYMETTPDLFDTMVRSAHALIGSPYFLDIIQNMVQIHQRINVRLEDEPLQCLVEQMEDGDCMEALCEDQGKLLQLIQILQKAGDSCLSRTRCLRVLLLNAQYGSRGRQWRLQWSKELLGTVGHLMEEGADPTWIPQRVYEDDDGYVVKTEDEDDEGSALYNFLQRIPLILAHDTHLYDTLLSVLPRFLTEQCLSHRETRGPVSVIHALTDYDWKQLPENLPWDFSKQYRGVISTVVEASPALLDLTDIDGRNPLQCFLSEIAKCQYLRRFVNDIAQALRTENSVNAQDNSGRNILHLLAEKCLQIGHEVFLELYSSLKLASLRDIGDKNGQTVLHVLAGGCSQIGHEAFLEIFRSINLASLRDVQDKDGQTVLHILARAALEYQELGSGLLTIFPLLITESNVNLADYDSVLPLSWILVAKARWGNSERDRNIFSRIEEIFVSKGADADEAKSPAFRNFLYRWIGQMLSGQRCTSDGLQICLSGLKILPTGNTLPGKNTLSCLKEFKDQTWKNMWVITNAKYIPAVMEILRILVADQSSAQHAWTSMMKYSRDHLGKMKEMTLTVMEILCLCADRGAQPTDEDLLKIFKRTNTMTKSEELTVSFLKTLAALSRNKNFVKTLVALQLWNRHFTFDLQFLGDVYIVSQEMLELATQFVHAVYGTVDSPLKPWKFIDCLLFVSHEQGKVLEEKFIEKACDKNWLCRSPLHLAVMILRSENSLKSIPQSILTKNINAKDIHGCTPLHLAYLHHNKHAVQYLINCGARQDVTDNFGMRPKSLESFDTPENHPDVKYKELCRRVLEAKCGMRPFLIHSEVAAKALNDEVKTLFERLVKDTQFGGAQVNTAGAIREKLKSGCIDEVDVLLLFRGEKVSIYEVSIERTKWDKSDLLEQLLYCLKKRLAEISWEGIDLRPISVHGPWKFLSEGVTVSIDVKGLIVYEGTEPNIHELAGELLGGMHPLHRKIEHCTLQTLNDKGIFSFKDTYLEYEWDMIDSLPASCSLAIVIAKALVQVYDLCRGDPSRVTMPITPYMVKTALFYILAYNCSELQFTEKDILGKDNDIQPLRNALGQAEGKMSEVNMRLEKLEYNPQPEWATDGDVDQFGEESRVWVRKIFTLIKCLTQQVDENAPQGWKLNSYWDREVPVVKIEGYGEAECICDVCDCALERIDHIPL